MKFKLSYAAFIAGFALLQACGGGSMVSGGKDKDNLTPVSQTITEDLPKPSASAATITTTSTYILDSVNKKPMLLRGVNLRYGDAPDKNFDGITALSSVGSNVVRLQVYEDTTALQLEAALAKIMDLKMIAVVSLAEKEPKGKISCTEDKTQLDKDVADLWLKKWVPTLAQDRFQGNLIINIADGWGPLNIFNQESGGYSEYIDEYKVLIRKFRNAGFNVPLLIDAPSCGQDYMAFMNGRADELMAADTAKNLILGVQADGGVWNSEDKIVSAMTGLKNVNVPFLMTSFAGSETGDKPISQSLIMQKAFGDSAINLALPWVSTSDAAAYSVAFSKVQDMRGASVGMRVYVDKKYLEKVIIPIKNYYTPTGKLQFALYLTDAKGNRLKAGTMDAKALNGDAWNLLKFTVKSVDAANLMNGATEFDLKSVAKAGVEVLANGKATTVGADIKFDDLTVYPGVPPMYEATFDSSEEEWSLHWGAASVANSGGSLTIQPTGGELAVSLQGWKAPSLYKINPAKTLDVTLRMFVPTDFANDGIWFKFFAQFGSGWDIWLDKAVDTAQIKYGEWSDVKVRLAFNESGKDISVFQSLGMQMGGFSSGKTNPIKIDSITVQDPDAKATVTVTATQYTIKFNSGVEGFADNGWDGSKGALSQDNGELVLTPDWSGGHNLTIGKADFNSIQEIDFSGPFRVKAKIFIPESYTPAADSAYFQFYFQDASWNWVGVWVGNLNQFKMGDWATIDVPVNFPDNANRSARPNTFGFQIGGDTLSSLKPTGGIRLDNIEFIGNKEVETAEPLEKFDFETLAQQNAFKFDFATGGFSESVLASSKSWGYKVFPFGWMAATWVGSPNAALDLSKNVKVVDLTDRGQEVVNGTYGIKATQAALGQ